MFSLFSHWKSSNIKFQKEFSENVVLVHGDMKTTPFFWISELINSQNLTHTFHELHSWTLLAWGVHRLCTIKSNLKMMVSTKNQLNFQMLIFNLWKSVLSECAKKTDLLQKTMSLFKFIIQQKGRLPFSHRSQLLVMGQPGRQLHKVLMSRSPPSPVPAACRTFCEADVPLDPAILQTVKGYGCFGIRHWSMSEVSILYLARS